MCSICWKYALLICVCLLICLEAALHRVCQSDMVNTAQTPILTLIELNTVNPSGLITRDLFGRQLMQHTRDMARLQCMCCQASPALGGDMTCAKCHVGATHSRTVPSVRQ